MVSNDIADDYILYYPQHNKLYKGNKLDIDGIGITCKGLNENNEYVLEFEDVDFTTTAKSGIEICRINVEIAIQ